MDAPEKIPLQDAVARELIPCSVCGAKGADVRQAEGKKHFLCAACVARGRRWTWAAIAALLVVLGVVAALRLGSSGPSPEDEARRRIQEQIDDLLRRRQFREAMTQIAALLRQTPEDPILNLWMGKTCMGLGYFQPSIPHLQMALAGSPPHEAECRILLGEALHYLGHSAQALPFLEKPYSESDFEKGRGVLLAECYLDLERYPEALQQLEGRPADPVVLRHRHRALLYMGKPDEARKVFDAVDPGSPFAAAFVGNRAVVMAMQSREEGDFAGALRILEEAEGKVEPRSFHVLQLRSMAMQVHVESGDLEKLEKTASELSTSQISGEALYYRALGRLMAGKREEAVALAKDFLGRTDVAVGRLRPEILMMQHLSGTRKDEDLAKEAAQVNRFRANDLFFYLALATGDAEWARKALEATPGRNFPYHAIQRLLKK